MACSSSSASCIDSAATSGNRPRSRTNSSWYFDTLTGAGAAVAPGTDPTALPRACKNAVEVEGAAIGGYGPRPRPLPVRGTEEEFAAHAAFVAKVLKDKAIWNTLDA